jgi:hypothetical protein
MCSAHHRPQSPSAATRLCQHVARMRLDQLRRHLDGDDRLLSSKTLASSSDDRERKGGEGLNEISRLRVVVHHNLKSLSVMIIGHRQHGFHRGDGGGVVEQFMGY